MLFHSENQTIVFCFVFIIIIIIIESEVEIRIQSHNSFLRCSFNPIDLLLHYFFMFYLHEDTIIFYDRKYRRNFENSF